MRASGRASGLGRRRGDGRGADLGDGRRVQHRDQLAGDAVVQQHRALVRVEPAGRVVRGDHDLLERERRVVAARVGGHQPHQSAGPAGASTNRSGFVQLAAGERREDVLHRGDARLHVEQLAHVVLGEDEHAHAKTSVSGRGRP